MRDKLLYWSALSMGILAFIIFASNVAIINGNRASQLAMNERQNFIANIQNLSTLNQNLAQTLADISAKEKDSELKDMLASLGIVVSTPAVVNADEAPASDNKARKQ
jgi:hypothetical protein